MDITGSVFWGEPHFQGTRMVRRLKIKTSEMWQAGVVADCMVALLGFPEEGSTSSKTFLPNPPLQFH